MIGRLAPAALVLVFFVQALGASLVKTPTFDEPAHIGAGLSYLRTREFKVNLQHPPLLKELAALPLPFAGAHWPMTEAGWKALGPRAEPSFQWRLGEVVLFSTKPDRVLFWARLPMLLLATLLAWVVWAWGRRMLGPVAGLGALGLFAFDPTLIAHGPLVTTDVGCAALATAFLFGLWRYLQARTRGRLLACGVLLGLALAAKFSAIFLLPIAAILVLLGARWIAELPSWRVADPADAYASSAMPRRLVECARILLAMAIVAAVVVWAVYFFRDPRLYLDGIRQINADHDPAYQPFMAGEFGSRFWTYYLVAYMLKEPIPSILLAALGAWAICRRGAAPALDRAFLFVPPVVFGIAYTLFSDNLGFRYVIPVLPFLHLLGGFGFATLLAAGRAGQVVGAALGVWLVATTIGVHPDHLSYFNEAACLPVEVREIGRDGGTRCGTYWLDDSNVDWGQGLKQLAAWLAANPSPGPVRLAAFSSLPAERYGVRAEPLDARILARAPPPGRYVLSAHVVARLRGALATQSPDAWFLTARPSAFVGRAYWVYDVPPR